MTTCPSCLRSVPDEALSCPACGAAIVASVTPTRHQPAVAPAYQAGSPALSNNAKVNRCSAPYVSEERFIAGALLASRYRIVGLLGKGGMGHVYKAEDLKLHQTVALKFLPETIALDAASLVRFHNEVRIARQVAHPNVCRVYDIGEVEGLHFLSMEFIDGEDLGALLKKVGRLPGDKAIELARQICAGLAAAHEAGVLHRDLKPANVMIDGRGKVRITDFGLAVVSEEIREDEVQIGTPAYMAPEQLSGKEVSQRSDIYSLGLVLYELFTGKRVFEAKSVTELISLHEKSAPMTPSSHVKEIDPLAERVILRCLKKDPKARPASAVQVALSLPGGDPLQAALALGETPSPEMVAAAGEKTGLQLRTALGCAVAIIVGIILCAALGNKVDTRAQLMRENSPDTLAVKARDIINRLGYTDRPLDRAYGLQLDKDYSLEDRSFKQLPRQPLSAIYFWYRESPRYLETETHLSRGWVSEDDPPQDVSGMVGVKLDPLGRLLALSAVPPELDQSSGPFPAPDWSSLFAAAGLDQTRFTSAEPKWNSMNASDTRAAWTGLSSDQPNIPVRIEAAAYHGKPVYFQRIEPRTTPRRMQSVQQTTGWQILTLLPYLLSLGLTVGAALLARYNFRHGRGDQHGAFRLATFIFVMLVLAWVFGASHVPTRREQVNFVNLGVAMALVIAAIVWLLYLALEPYVRRHWPNTIISWSRILAGNLRDPLVGRDVLIGVLLGVGTVLAYQGINLLGMWRGISAPVESRLYAWLGPRYLLSVTFYNSLYILLALFLFFLIFVVRVFTRRDWIAGVIVVLIWAMLGIARFPSIDISHLLIVTLFVVLFGVRTIFALWRFGLVTLITAMSVDQILGSVPITTDFSAWYFGSTVAVVVAVLALAGFAFHTSLGGQNVFVGKLLEVEE